MGQPHKHAKLIKAWADGADIQARETEYFAGDNLAWIDTKNPTWYEYIEYRIKPKTIKYRLYLDRYGAVRVQETPEDPLCWFVKYLTEWTEVEI